LPRKSSWPSGKMVVNLWEKEKEDAADVTILFRGWCHLENTDFTNPPEGVPRGRGQLVA